MPAVLMHRLSGLRPALSVAWTPRAALLFARQRRHLAASRSFTALPPRSSPNTAIASGTSSSDHDDVSRYPVAAKRGSQRPSSARQPGVLSSADFLHKFQAEDQRHRLSDVDATLEMLKDGYQASLASPRRLQLQLPQPQPQPQPQLPQLPSPEQEASKPSTSGRSRRRSRLVYRSLGQHMIKEKYRQWGYLRHQFSPAELVPARRRFNSWKWKLHVVRHQRRPSSWPWEEQGRWVFELDSPSDMRQAWEEHDSETRREMWPGVMLSTLHLCPDKAHLVLEATLDPLPPGYAISDTLLQIAQSMDLDAIKTAQERIARSEEMLELLTKILLDLPAGHVPFYQRTFGILATKMRGDHAVDLYQILLQLDTQLHPHTLLHFASKFAKMFPHKQKAMEILLSLADRGADLNQSQYASVITTLLHAKLEDHDMWQVNESPFSPQAALEQFIEKGFLPNIKSITSMVGALCVRGEMDEALRLPFLLVENGVELDVKLYATIFRGAKLSLKVEHVQRAFDVAEAAKAPTEDVLNNALHAIFYFSEMEGREIGWTHWVRPIFAPMLRIYAKKFELGPLQWLLPDSLPLILAQDRDDGFEKFNSLRKRHWNFQQTIIPAVDEYFSRVEGPRLKPSSTTLAIMLRAYLKSLHRPHDLTAFYSFFRSRLEEGGSRNWTEYLIRKEGSIIHDTCILAMSQHRDLTDYSIQVFSDMLKDAIKAREAETSKADSEDGAKASYVPVHPAPSIFTFCILFHGLFLKSETSLVNQMLDVMRDEGVEPNIVFWNSLVRGYASLQKITRTVGTLQDLEAAGFKPDADTFKAFGRLRDQTRALEMMETIIETNKERMAQKLLSR